MPQVVRREADGTAGVSPLELFFDLVFVFAVTQLSHLLLDHLSWEGAGQTVVCLLVVWWAWNFTTWFTNEVDTQTIAVRAIVIALMAASLLMAVAIPEAFGDRGLLFASAYVAMQVGRQSFLTFAAAGPRTIERRRAANILFWFVVAGAFWIAGAIAEGEARTALWLLALAIDYVGPLVVYALPGRPMVADAWDVRPEHFAERFRLFVIIALGESIVLIGVATSELELTTATLAALMLCFLATAALWWLYFNSISELTERLLTRSEHRTTVARDIYAYMHVILIAGIAAAAVGFELVIAHPTEALSEAELAVLVGGPALYLLGQAAMRLRLTRVVSARRAGGAAACVAVGLLLSSADALVVTGGLLAVLAALIIADQVQISRRTAEDEERVLREAVL